MRSLRQKRGRSNIRDVLGNRGQSGGGGAATLIIVMILLIVLYIILLPPEERVALLEDDGNGNSGSHNRDRDSNFTLLEEHPGRLEVLKDDKIDHNIDPFILYRTTESNVIKQENSFTVRSGWFDKKEKSIRFDLDDLSQTDNILLSFTAPINKGTLTITLNGETIFEADLSSPNPTPISIDKDFLQESNTLVFTVGSVGWQFWTTNEYSIEAFKLTGDLTDTSREQSTNTFVISDMENNNIDEVRLKFNPDCVPNNVGNLEISVNNNRIFTGIPDCGILNTKQFSPAYLESGQNTLSFKTNEGSYLVDNIKITTDLKELSYPFYYFDINESLWQDFEDGNLDFELKLRFFDDNKIKKAQIFINGRKTFVSLTNTSKSQGVFEAEWSRVINSYVEAGTNGIKIEPDGDTIDVVELRVDAFETD